LWAPETSSARFRRSRPYGSAVTMAGHKNRALLHAARAEARRFADEHPSPGTTPLDALQWLVNRVTDQLKHAAHRADSLAEDEMEVMGPFGPIPNKWIRLETDLRQELGTLAINMERVGLAERMVNLQEARAALVVQALVAAAEEAGIPRHKLKVIGPAFRRHLTLLQGGGEGGAAGRAA
jgi:hypothetical protein